MSAANNANDADDQAPADRPTSTPFIAALAIIVLVVIGIFLVNAYDDPELTPDQQIRAAVVGQNAALQRADYAKFQQFTCRAAHGDETEVLAGQKESVEQHGERYVDSVNDLSIEGDRATAKATYYFDNTPDDKTTSEVTLVREDGAWKVCEG